MERRLDSVEEKHDDWVSLLHDFYAPFAKDLEEAEEFFPKIEIKEEQTDETCPNCGRPMVIKNGRFGRFIACTGYPECKTTKPIVKDSGVNCPRTAAASSSAAQERTHVLRLRELSDVRFRLLGPRSSLGVQRVRRVRGAQVGPQRRSVVCGIVAHHDHGLKRRSRHPRGTACRPVKSASTIRKSARLTHARYRQERRMYRPLLTSRGGAAS